MKVLIMAGGTGGHVYPALAVAQELKKRGHSVTWMGTPDSFESRVVARHEIPLDCVQVGGLRGKGFIKLALAPFILLRALIQALRILKRQRPDVVLGMGGFASGPGGVAARLQRVPLVIHEQNAVAGLTNRLLSKVASRALQAFPSTFDKVQAITVGNPVRGEVIRLPAPWIRGHGRFGATRMLVVGGSQGARALNEIIPAAIGLLPAAQRPYIRHQAGRTLEVAQDKYKQYSVKADVVPFIEDMAEAYAWADLVVCRAGASTIAELAAAGCASVLIPFPAAVDDHQTRNAQYLAKGNAALIVPERGITAETMSLLLAQLLGDRARLGVMARAARSLAKTDCVSLVIDQLQSVATP